MKRNYIKYLLYGILFVGTQEFWVSVLWDGNIRSFILAVVILEVLFLTVTYILGKLIDKIFSKIRIADIVAYVVSGIIGLVVIEWMFVGNTPDKLSTWHQFVMFGTWGGSALFARMHTDMLGYTAKVKKYAMRFFLSFAGIATVLGIIFVGSNHQVSFVITYFAAIIGYPLMNIFYIWYFAKKIKGDNS